jgi:hypothetical protein
MSTSEKSQHAIRRSTRLPLEVPVRITSLSPDAPFDESCNTTLVNAHGCGLISPRAVAGGISVRIEIVSARRHTTAHVAEVVPLGGAPETWLVGLELDIPGNFWGIEYAPSDWKSDWKIEEIPAPAPVRQPEPATDRGGNPARARRWRLTDISSGACYLEAATPFAVGVPVLISIRSLDKEFLLDGVVRASHPQTGMGVEFTDAAQRRRAEELIEHLTEYREVPRIFVGRKEGKQATESSVDVEADADSPDPLLDLVRDGSSLSVEQFLSDLRAQRLGKRRDPRIDIALPVLLTGVDASGRPLDQRVITVNISRRGALLEGIHGVLRTGDAICLTSGNRKEEFRVAWVVDDESPAGSKIGVAAVNQNSSFWNEVLDATSDAGLESASLRRRSESTGAD